MQNLHQILPSRPGRAARLRSTVPGTEPVTVSWVRSRPVAAVIPLLGATDREVAESLGLDVVTVSVLREITTACGLFPDLFGRVLAALGAQRVPEYGWVFP
jgi:hypothetical protein